MIEGTEQIDSILNQIVAKLFRDLTVDELDFISYHMLGAVNFNSGEVGGCVLHLLQPLRELVSRDSTVHLLALD